MKSTDKVQSEIIENDNIREVHVKHVHNHYYHPSKRKYKKKEPENKDNTAGEYLAMFVAAWATIYGGIKVIKSCIEDVKQWRAKR